MPAVITTFSRREELRVGGLYRTNGRGISPRSGDRMLETLSTVTNGSSPYAERSLRYEVVEKEISSPRGCEN
jgi:hypothetical protein